MPRFIWPTFRQQLRLIALCLSLLILYLLPIVIVAVVVAPNWDYTDWNSLVFAAGVLVPELLPHPDDR